MSGTSHTFTPGPTPNTVRSVDGKILTAPEGWVLLPPGDAALTRRVKAAGDHWVVAEKKGRKVFSRGVWAPAATIERIRADLEAERSTEGFAKKKEADARRRDKAQAEYVEDFLGAVRSFLAFHGDYADLADRMARAVTDHATPVGSGTVARTKRIPVEQRAEAAVIAWMRHKTTAYESMAIPRIRGKRREVRRMLARRSHELLDVYRRGEAVPEGCPLQKALAVAISPQTKLLPGNPIMDESKEFNDLHLPHLLRCVVPILWNPMNVGSGVLVDVQGRHFVASAAHCIQSNPLIQICPTPVNLHTPVETRTLRPRLSGWHHDIDIGYVEIDDPGCEALNWDQLSNAPEFLTGQVHVVGYPQANVKVDLTTREALFGITTFSTSIIEATPEHLKLRYPVQGSSYDAASGTWIPCQFPKTPHGFSGGGVFVVAKAKVGGLEVIQYKLVAIQTCWMESERYVKAIPIESWCDLLKSNGIVSS